MCTLLVLFLKRGKSPCSAAKHSFQCFDRACATWGDNFWCETAYVPFQIFGRSVSIRCCMMWQSSQAVSWSKSLSLRGEDSWGEISSYTCSNVSIWREMSHKKRVSSWITLGDKEAARHQQSTQSVFQRPDSSSLWLTAVHLFSGHADRTLQIWLWFSEWSKPRSNYSSGTVITQSLSMHLITGVLTKNNRSWTPFTQNEIWRGDREMITACKSSHKIGGYYVSYSNGLFNKNSNHTHNITQFITVAH